MLRYLFLLFLFPLMASLGCVSGRQSLTAIWPRLPQEPSLAANVSEVGKSKRKENSGRGWTTLTKRSWRESDGVRWFTASCGSVYQSAATLLTSPFLDRGNKSKDVLSLDYKTPQPGPDLYVSMARIAERSNNFEVATEKYREALELAPQNKAALTGYARLVDRQGDFGKAIDLYRKLIEYYPNHAAAQNDLGMCLIRCGQKQKALVALSRAVDLQSDRDLYRNNMAMLLVDLGRSEEAWEHLSHVHTLSVAHYNLGYLLYCQGDNRGAAQHFAAALKEDPRMSLAQEWLVKVDRPREISDQSSLATHPPNTLMPSNRPDPMNTAQPPFLSTHSPGGQPNWLARRVGQSWRDNTVLRPTGPVSPAGDPAGLAPNTY